jgi:hypothetical protein
LKPAQPALYVFDPLRSDSERRQQPIQVSQFYPLGYAYGPRPRRCHWYLWWIFAHVFSFRIRLIRLEANQAIALL